MIGLVEKHFLDTFGDQLPPRPDRDYGLKFADVDSCSSSDSELGDVLDIQSDIYSETEPANGP